MPLLHQQAVCFLRYNFINILYSLTNCVSVSTSSASLPAPSPVSIAVLMAVIVPVPAPAPASLSFSFSSSSSSSSSCKSSVVRLSDSPSSPFQPLPPPPPPAFSTAHLVLHVSIQCTGTHQVLDYNRIDYAEQQCSLVKITITSQSAL